MTDRIEYDDGRVLVGTGTYHDEYACTDGRWLIRSTRLARDALAWS
jgi:hypothetical protein